MIRKEQLFPLRVSKRFELTDGHIKSVMTLVSSNISLKNKNSVPLGMIAMHKSVYVVAQVDFTSLIVYLCACSVKQ